MISRLIEAKPEDMRVFLEEAAGISKYKERRRETSNRIRSTRENLDRLMDVLEEVEKQIKHLDRQAKTAERYGRLKEDERRISAELLALRLRQLDERAREAGNVLSERETALEATIAEQRKIEAGLEQARVTQSERLDGFNAVQARYYRAGSEIARLEQAIEHANEMRERQRRDLEQAQEGAREIAEHINKDRSEIEQLELTLNDLQPDLERAKETERQSLDSLERAEKALADWQERWENFSRKSNEAQQIRNVEQTRAEQLESRLKSLVERRGKLEEVEQSASTEELKTRFGKFTDQELRKRQACDEFDRAIADTTDKIRKLREQDQRLSKLADERRATLQVAEARYTSLDAVQKAALGVGDEGIGAWLESNDLHNNARVVQMLDVEDGWDRAVETVLGQYLQAVCVADIENVSANFSQIGSGSLTLLSTELENDVLPEKVAALADKVRGAPAPIAKILRSVRIADSLAAALSQRRDLPDNQSVVTPEGIWMSRSWLRVSRDKDPKAGILSREHVMRRLKNEIRELQTRADGARKLLQDGRARLGQLEERRETLQQDAGALLKEYSEVKANLDSARFQLDQANARKAAIADESGDIEKEFYSAEVQLQESRARFSNAAAALAELENRREELEAQREELRAELRRVRDQAQQDRQAAHDIAIHFESRRTSKESAAQSLARMQAQLRHFGDREAEIRSQLEQSEGPLAENKKSLDLQLAARVDVENELSAARHQVEEIECQLRELDQNRLREDRAVDEARASVNEARLVTQEIRVRREGLAEQFAQTDYDFDTLIQSLADDAELTAWEGKLESIRTRIDRLGPINLAAIDEFKEQSERKEYLDSQLADLNNALNTLEGAIRKIDRETRTRFRATFDNVDAGFKRLFPKLFGGGHAYLELTGDDLLAAGVTVMARPPGKRNSTIHLLSGGEKALTAVALVFAIFELNPAPFCLLDEVDAPLDDANVARFCDIVREMSEKVQFVFITHNKVTMEMARQLTGVTMQEPGVSRVVSVDLDEAVRMAAS
jgi:chromosome segregation protein